MDFLAILAGLGGILEPVSEYFTAQEQASTAQTVAEMQKEKNELYLKLGILGLIAIVVVVLIIKIL